MNNASNPALVLSGGGARGAYEVGIIKGLVEILNLRPESVCPFKIFTGTSVGAINVSHLAANAHRGDMGVTTLERTWGELSLEKHLRLNFFSIFGGPSSLKSRFFSRKDKEGQTKITNSILDSKMLEETITSSIPWNYLHRNVSKGIVKALIVAALEIRTGHTMLFAELSPDEKFVPSNDPHRLVRQDKITPDHVLASAAIPVLFPARKISGSYFCDGGLRFNTPIAPAIRAGADRLMVVSVMHDTSRVKYPRDIQQRRVSSYPDLPFLLGKLLNALLLDPVVYDLQILERFNRLVDVLERTLTDDEMARVQETISGDRGIPYRQLQTLLFMPSQSISAIAAEYIETHLRRRKMTSVAKLLMRVAANSSMGKEADLTTYLLFDGAFVNQLIELGYKDALARKDEMEAFFRGE